MDYYELAWAAGFLDGEGCTRFNRSGRQTNILISQKEPTSLARFLKAVGFEDTSIYGPNKRGMYNISLNTKKTIVSLGKLWRFMGEPKRQQALGALSELSEYLDGRQVGRVGGETKTHCKRMHELTPENVYIGTKGERQCKECRRLAKQRAKERIG